MGAGAGCGKWSKARKGKPGEYVQASPAPSRTIVGWKNQSTTVPPLGAPDSVEYVKLSSWYPSAPFCDPPSATQEKESPPPNPNPQPKGSYI